MMEVNVKCSFCDRQLKCCSDIVEVAKEVVGREWENKGDVIVNS